MIVLPLLFLLQAMSSPPSAREAIEVPFDAMWAKVGAQFRVAGVTRAEAKQAFAWSVLQKQLGVCKPYLKPDDVLFWRDWLRDRRVTSTPELRMMLDRGDAEYRKALSDPRPDWVSADSCPIVVASVIEEMKR